MNLPLSEIYHSLLLTRRVEEEIARIYHTDKVKSPVHLSIGQEAVSVGVCLALRPDDLVFPTYRGHAAYIAKGGDLNAMVAELYGKATGCAKGKGGSMHLIDLAAGIMGCSAVVATGIPQAVGHAMANRLLKRDQLAVSFFGDGAVEEGVFGESLNFAALKQLPVLFVCENNGYAVHSRRDARQPAGSICAIAEAHGIPAVQIDNNDVLAIYTATKKLSDEIRDGSSGPRFIECLTYRWKEHVGPGEDYHFGYRSRDEAQVWLETDQVACIAAMLKEPDRMSIEKIVEDEVAKAFEYAENSPFPEPSALLEDAYA